MEEIIQEPVKRKPGRPKGTGDPEKAKAKRITGSANRKEELSYPIYDPTTEKTYFGFHAWLATNNMRWYGSTYNMDKPNTILNPFIEQHIYTNLTIPMINREFNLFCNTFRYSRVSKYRNWFQMTFSFFVENWMGLSVPIMNYSYRALPWVGYMNQTIHDYIIHRLVEIGLTEGATQNKAYNNFAISTAMTHADKREAQLTMPQVINHFSNQEPGTDYFHSQKAQAEVIRSRYESAVANGEEPDLDLITDGLTDE